ncbi:hypothetical protein [Streptomyces sp. SAS_276]|uniref:hypothetical protein n=1 Tax=Streptomyces sp. SAS_276 TaxID=3412745 RepID=UPI00403C88E4
MDSENRCPASRYDVGLFLATPALPQPWQLAVAGRTSSFNGSTTPSSGSAVKRPRSACAALARRADASRTFLYGNPEARTTISAAMAQAGEHRSRVLSDQDDEREATWRERALDAENALKVAHAEVATQRTRIGEPLGEIRGLETA